jgi:RNA-splicing ligase RtcB
MSGELRRPGKRAKRRWWGRFKAERRYGARRWQEECAVRSKQFAADRGFVVATETPPSHYDTKGERG